MDGALPVLQMAIHPIPCDEESIVVRRLHATRSLLTPGSYSTLNSAGGRSRARHDTLVQRGWSALRQRYFGSLIERDLAVLQKIDPVAEIENLGIIVSHNDDRNIALFLEAQDYVQDH